jgi:16S rRNA (adenine1518-N6/adenine1519-N6)-dimethyltransferase
MKKFEIISLLNKYSARPKKSLGQNFLMDANVVKKIVQTANVSKHDCIVEVGPGLGFLTKELAKTGAAITSVELDNLLIPLLSGELKNCSNVKIIHEDALKFSPPKTSYKVVANIPYYITSPLISHFLNAKNRPEKMVLLVQKEVAEKICAKEGNLNVLAIHVQIFGKPKIASKVSRGCFYPVPKVNSAILEIDMHEKPLVEDKNRKNFLKLVHAGFAHRRKTIINSLTGNLDISSKKIRDALNNCEIALTVRAEKLTIDMWNCLTNKL